VSARPTTDQLIAAWTTEVVGSGAADYLPEVMAVVNRTSQNRFARWLPTAWTVAPARAPKLRTGIVLVAMLALLVALAVGTLVAGGLRRPAFTLQSVVPLPGSVGVIFASASDSAVWATVEGGVVRIDPATGTTSMLALPGVSTQLTGVLEHDGALWVTEYGADRVVRIDPTTGQVTGEVSANRPGGLAWEHGVWAGGKGEVIRIDHVSATVDLRLADPSLGAYAVVPGALWYLTRSGDAASAVEVDPATGVERRRIAVAAGAAESIAIDAAGNPWVWSRSDTRSTIVALDAARGTAGEPFDVPYDVIGGVVPAGGSMWALPFPNDAGGSRIVELSPAGPTGRTEALTDGLDPDVPTIAFGSLWIPWDSHGELYRYPVDALAR
jgi:hypothetical protein